ncbi:hypothetical protein [Cohnella thermotolerans]|uniref:hypothetical protein n=1 Tax=Cohnella thermotolerans TaxID=329858 RepID=UPI0004005CFA|nr:hypothetical protein [Cohnella thermotolerans]
MSALLGELYVSAALQKHYEGEADLERIVAEMKGELAKDRKGEWGSGGASAPVGFLAR